MKVLLSIRPEYALKILNGSKRFEYRRVIFKNQEVTTVVVYASQPIGKVIGEFDIGGILCDEPCKLWQKTHEHSGITEQRFHEYFSKRNSGYAIKIRQAREYDCPLLLSALEVRCPPQSFAYLR